jgi:4-hydroxybenzoate polyprenyltransferase
MSTAAPLAAPNPVRLLATISRLHIVAIATMGCFTFGWLFSGRYLLATSALCGLDWFLVNLLNRVVDLREDTANRIMGTDFVARHRRLILRGGFGLLFGSLAAVAFWPPLAAATPLRIAYHALGFAYNWPLRPGGRRLKQLYFFKNCASATGFLITVFGYPLAVCGWGQRGLPPGIGLGTILMSGAFFFLFELSYEVIYDLRDAPGDAAAGVRTYPVVHGERGAVAIIDGLLAAAVVVLAAGFAWGLLPWRIFIMVIAPLVQLVLYKRALARGITSADCIGLTWLGAGLLLSYHLWVLAGLPGVGGVGR